jgi:hypothetical protein
MSAAAPALMRTLLPLGELRTDERRAGRYPRRSRLNGSAATSGSCQQSSVLEVCPAGIFWAGQNEDTRANENEMPPRKGNDRANARVCEWWRHRSNYQHKQLLAAAERTAIASRA